MEGWSVKQVAWSFGVAAVLGASGAGLVISKAANSADAPSISPRSSAGMEIDLSAIDPTANACQNFYQHACGGFINSVELTPTRSQVSLSDQQFDANVEKSLNELFAIQAPTGSELDRLNTFHQSCLGNQQSSVALTRRWLERIDAARTPTDMRELMLELSAIGVNPFFNYAGSPDPDDLKKYRGEIDYSNLWQQPAVVERAFVMAGIPAAQAKSDAEAVRAIVTELRKHRTTGNEQAGYENSSISDGTPR